MDKKPTWWQIQKIKWGLGQPLALSRDLGRADETVIRYKDKFISILEDPETGEIKSLSWSTDHNHFPASNINDFWTSAPPAKYGEK